jgi:hypothetical protein
VLRPADAPRARAPRGALLEFLLAGGVTPFLFPLAWLLRKGVGLDAAELGVGFTMFYAAHLINDPHFAVTYLLFYEDGRARAFGSAFAPWQRLRWVVAGFVVPLVLGAWAVGALATRSAAGLGRMMELMFLLVGWHYVKQGFGVMVVLAARRGVRFGPRERLIVLAHCFAGWAYAWASPAAVAREVEEKGVVYLAFPHPAGLERVTLAVCLATAALLAGMLVRKRLREGRLPIVTPLAALLSSIWVWSIYSSLDPLVQYVTPALHSVQYLYFVWLLKGGEAREREGPPWFQTSAHARLGILAASAVGLGWLLFHGAPTALDDMFVPHRARGATLPMGPTPYFAALYAFVNLHHYFMDHVIWRRDNPRTRYLLG